MAQDDKTKKVVEAAASADAASQAEASPAKGGKVTDDEGVLAKVNPELGNTQAVEFHDGEGNSDVYAVGAVHTVPSAYLDIKNGEGVAYLVKAE
jgi:hypothetical protein